jgi:Flp pilus assembly pilin Flp
MVRDGMLKRESGSSAVEYALLLGTIVLTMMLSLVSLRTALVNPLQVAAQALSASGPYFLDEKDGR